MKKLFIYLYILFGYTLTFSQSDKTFFIRGNLNINNNGIDWVPLFSRDKPSLISNFSIAGERLSISPLIRYELDGFQPWGFDIWWDYKIKNQENSIFQLEDFSWIVNQKITVQDDNLPTTILQPWSSAIVKPSISYFLIKTLD